MSGWDTLRDLGVKIRPLSIDLTPGNVAAPFRSSWTDTVDLLAREADHLSPREVIIEAAFREQDLRLDGFPRATARAEHDGVVLTLIGTPHGDLRYPCATYTASGWGEYRRDGWQHNLRAIALALEALRKVDRYGVTKRGEQYAGWKALPRGSDDGDAARGERIIAQHGSVAAALKATHPDHGGSDEDFRDVQAARQRAAA